MAKVIIELPTHFNFSTDVQVLIQHINRANHLANENLVALLNEARMRFMASLTLADAGMSEREFINADLAVVYKSEAHHGDILQIDVAANDFSRYGCDFVYKVSQKSSGQLVAIAKTAMLRYNYDKQALEAIDPRFKQLFDN
jgi:acyl-CoA thioesterase FadM